MGTYCVHKFMAVQDTQSHTLNQLRSLTEKEQKIRLQRLRMSFLSQGVTFLMVVFCWAQDKTPLFVLRDFAILTLVGNGAFLVVFYFNINLKFKEKSLTGAQMVVALFPPAWVVYFLEEGQARATILFIAIVAALYGIFSLNTRQFLKIALVYLLVYIGLIVTLWVNKPEFIKVPLELMQAFTFTLVMTQIAVIGGYINRLKNKLREKNNKLNATMAELHEALQQINQLAQTDELTGIHNRRKVLDILAKEINRCGRSKETFSVAMLDVDHFKSINDNYGHQVGDEVLTTIATVVQNCLRNIDNFGRYGGEEFLLIMFQTKIPGAQVSAERIRKALSDLEYPNISSDFKVTMSMGLAEHRLGETLEDILARADNALYLAKHRGRDCVVVSDES